MFSASLLPLAFLLPFAAVPVTADTYDMVVEYSGENFFDDWSFTTIVSALGLIFF